MHFALVLQGLLRYVSFGLIGLRREVQMYCYAKAARSVLQHVPDIVQAHAVPKGFHAVSPVWISVTDTPTRCVHGNLLRAEVLVMTLCVLSAAENWVQPEKRERKQRVNYNQNHYFANAMGAQGGR